VERLGGFIALTASPGHLREYAVAAYVLPDCIYRGMAVLEIDWPDGELQISARTTGRGSQLLRSLAGRCWRLPDRKRFSKNASGLAAPKLATGAASGRVPTNRANPIRRSRRRGRPDAVRQARSDRSLAGRTIRP